MAGLQPVLDADDLVANRVVVDAGHWARSTGLATGQAVTWRVSAHIARRCRRAAASRWHRE